MIRQQALASIYQESSQLGRDGVGFFEAKYFRTNVPLQVASAVQLMLISILVSFYLGHLIPDHLIPVQILVCVPSRQILREWDNI